MKNGWTGGQYSLFRAVFATYLGVHFLLTWSESSGLAMVLRITAVALSIFFGLGLYDRAVALGLGVVWVYVFAWTPLLGNLTIPLVVGLLVAHAFLPPAPYGSWAARGRVDPGGGWRMPPAIFAAAWIVLALTYSYSGYTKFTNPSWRDGMGLVCIGTWTVLALELAFAPLAWVRRLRPWLWGLMLLLQLSLIPLLDFADLSLGMVLLHLFTWNPGWVRPLPAPTERLFYDGHCGLCQRSVRLILAEDSTGTAFRFAPLQGETFEALLLEKERAALPLSLVVQTAQGTLLTRSAAVRHIMRRLGGVWQLLAGLLVVLPVRLRDNLYDGVARIRHHIFAQPAESCPLMPPQLRVRFDP